MMGTTAKILTTGSLLVLTACATAGKQDDWIHTKANATGESYYADREGCKAYANDRSRSAGGSTYVGGGGLIGIFAVALVQGIAQGVARSRYQSECLTQLGYVRTLVPDDQLKHFNSISDDEEKKAFIISFIDDAGQNPWKYSYVDEDGEPLPRGDQGGEQQVAAVPFEARVEGLPGPLPPSTGFEDRNWVYARFGANGSIVQQQETVCRQDQQRRIGLGELNTTKGSDDYWQDVHSCMLDAGYARARLNKDQYAELQAFSSGEGRFRFLLGVIDDAGKNPGEYVYVEADLEALSQS